MSIEKLYKLISLYDTGQLGGKRHEVYPKFNKGSRENFLYFTLAPSINYQRKSEGLWKAALATYDDKSTQFVFFPEIVAKTKKEKVAVALTKHGLAVQKDRQTGIWTTICNTLYEHYSGDPRKLLKSYNNDVLEVIQGLQKDKKLFPYLSGPKLSNYWLYILSQFTNIKLSNLDKISVVPDTHIIQATQHLGLVSKEEVSPIKVAEVWEDLLQGTGLAPSDLHAPLWRWSRQGFKPEL